MLFRNHTCKSFCVRINCKPGHKFLILPKQTWSSDISSSYFTKNTFVIFCYGIVFHHILGHILKIAFPVLERLYVSSAITYHEMAGVLELEPWTAKPRKAVRLSFLLP